MILFPNPHTFIRFASAAYGADGDYDKGNQTELTFLGSVEPVQGRDVESRAVGREGVGTIRIFSDTALQITIEETGKVGDQIKRNGELWEVKRDLTWDNGLLDHFEYEAEYRGLG